MALWNGFWGPSFGAEADAERFHEAALDYAKILSNSSNFFEFEVGYIYSYVLGVCYHLVGSSLFFGSMLSVLIWFFSAVYLKKTLNLLSVDNNNQLYAMLIYALLPSSILFTGITMREPYELLLVNISFFSALKIYLNKSLIHWIKLFLAVGAMSALHTALLTLGLFIIASLVIMLLIRNNKGISILKVMFLLPLLLISLNKGLTEFSTQTYRLDEGIDVAVQGYLEGGLATKARTDYIDAVNIEDTTGLIMYIPISLLQYLFEPLPWRISELIDIGSFIENLLRFIMFWMFCFGGSQKNTKRSRTVLFIFVNYIFIEIIWSLGTINWGTAMRHHIPGSALLLIAVFAHQSAKKNSVTLNGGCLPPPPPMKTQGNRRGLVVSGV